MRTEAETSRLHDLLTVAENIPTKQLDQGHYKKVTSCGTKLCLFGAYVTRFRRRGFKFIDDGGAYFITTASVDLLQIHIARERHFGISPREDRFLFDSGGGHGYKAKRNLIAGLKRIIKGKPLVDNG